MGSRRTSPPNISFPPRGDRPTSPRPRPKPQPTRPEPRRPIPDEFINKPEPPRRGDDVETPTGFFGPKRTSPRPRPRPSEERRRRRMAGEKPVVIERVTTEAPRRPRFREDDTDSRDFEGFRQRRPRRDINIAEQDI